MKECQLCKNCYYDAVATCPQDGMPTMHTIAGEPVLEGKYHLESRLGQGGMGVVYKARHAYLKTQLAIKIILPDLVGNDPQLITRFRQEALAAAAIRHQNVVAVTDYGVIQGSIPFLVMEYVDGESLHDLLVREKRLDPEKALQLMTAICSGVGAAHQQGIVHRDLKPLNIMICNDKPSIAQAVKILDFGLAKIKSGELLGSFIQAQTTGLMGSPYFMAPEQWADEEPDSRSDVYSLGVMLYQMLVGDVPFKGTSIPAIMKKHVSDPPPPFADYGINFPPEIENAVFRTLIKEKEQRTGSVEQMIRELKDAVHPLGIGVHTTPGGASMPVSVLNVCSNPPKSKVFFDSIEVGETREDGWITLNGIQTGNHQLKISKPGFNDWLSEIVFDGRPQQVVANLATDHDLVEPTVAYSGGILQNAPYNLSSTPSVHRTDNQNQIFAPKKKGMSPVLISLAAIIVLAGLMVAGVGGAYFLGLFGSRTGVNEVDNGNIKKTPGYDPTISQPTKPDLVLINGGKFMMGRNDGDDLAKPAHEVEVKSFWLDKTEITNAEFREFLTAEKYQPKSKERFLAHWVNGKPIAGEEKMPVRFVNLDDVKAFIAWRSTRDGEKYRLPTEQEWEYAARNGAKGNLYPWGNEFKENCAVVDKASSDPEAVTTNSCPNDAGVHDLIGNLIEWTDTEPWAYPGSPFVVESRGEKKRMVRGGSAEYKSSGENAITATFRIETPVTTRAPVLGFRLARDQ